MLYEECLGSGCYHIRIVHTTKVPTVGRDIGHNRASLCLSIKWVLNWYWNALTITSHTQRLDACIRHIACIQHTWILPFHSGGSRGWTGMALPQSHFAFSLLTIFTHDSDMLEHPPHENPGSAPPPPPTQTQSYSFQSLGQNYFSILWSEGNSVWIRSKSVLHMLSAQPHSVVFCLVWT